MADIQATKKVTPAGTEKGVPLAPSAKDLKPWDSESLQKRWKMRNSTSVHQTAQSTDRKNYPCSEEETNLENTFMIH